jgi:hypothetical protein
LLASLIALPAESLPSVIMSLAKSFTTLGAWHSQLVCLSDRWLELRECSEELRGKSFSSCSLLNEAITKRALCKENALKIPLLVDGTEAGCKGVSSNSRSL